MKKHSFFIVLLFFMFSTVFILGLSFTKKEIPKWPEDKIEHDLPYVPETQNKLIPLEVFNQQPDMESVQEEYEEFPFQESEELEENYRLIPAQSPVKNQGTRGQCHTFAVTAAMEYAVWAGEEQALNFSEQCNAWKFFKDCMLCSLNPDSDNDGGWGLLEAFYIQNEFMKFEENFPYSEDPSPCQNEYNDEPYKEFEDLQVYWIKYDQIKKAIDNNFVVMSSIKWKAQSPNQWGEFPYETSYTECMGVDCLGHVVLIVGYDDNYYGDGKGGFIFKNSWSTHWGEEKGRKPAGYGVFPYPYLKEFKRFLTAVTHKNAYPYPVPCFIESSKSGWLF